MCCGTGWSLSLKFSEQMSLMVSVVLMRRCYLMAVVNAASSWACGTKTGNSAVVNNHFTCCGAVCVSVEVRGLFATYI